MLTSAAPMLPHLETLTPIAIRWFSGGGAVVERDGVVEVTVRGVLVGRYERWDLGARNAILVGLAAGPTIHLGQLADAFELTEERLRQIRRRAERDGLAAVVHQADRSRSKVDEATWARLARMFDDGLTIDEAHRRIARRVDLSRATVGTIRLEWLARARQAKVVPAAPPPVAALDPTAAPQLQLAIAAEPIATATATVGTVAVPPEAAPDDSPGRGRAVEGGFVQHAGSWLLLGVLARYGLYDELGQVAAAHHLGGDGIRTATDAFVTALAIGEPTVEGVRRLATSSGSLLLRASATPSPERVRLVLGQLARVGGQALHEGMARRLLALATVEDGPTVFYVDNHMRPYTGKRVVRRGWRMQDKRVRPGTTDLYIHDEDGRPVFRFTSPSHESLTSWLPRVAGWLRTALGEDRRILLAFDRAGAFPETIAALREESFELVTYERKPYRQLPARDFDREVAFDDGDEPEVVRYREQQIALGRGRGGARRVAMRMPDGRQVNLLAISAAPALKLMSTMRGRWVQDYAERRIMPRPAVPSTTGMWWRAA